MILALPRSQELLPLTEPARVLLDAAEAQATPQETTRRRPVPRPRRHLPTQQERLEGRKQAAEFRAYAEAWYRALRSWEVRLPEVAPAMNYAVFTSGWEPLSTLGEGGPDRPTALLTPIGEVREVEVARLITTMAASPVPDRRAAGQLLERVRGAFTAPASLLREEDSRWASPAPRMAGYAAAVLTLAVALGDANAEGPLRYAGAVMRRVEVAL